MATDIIDIRAKIYSMLQTLTTVDSSEVYDYDPNIIKEYPTLSLTYRGFYAEIKSQQTNWRTFKFKIKVYQERTNGGQTPPEAERITAEVLDEILTMFDTNVNLDRVVQIVTPISGDIGYEEKSQSRYSEIILECKKLVSTE